MMQVFNAKSLEEWLSYIEHLHSKPIDLGLDRMRELLSRMRLQFDCPLLIVGGTNGKGSTCTYMENICLQAGLKVALHTSPHIERFNERARVGGKEVTDETLVRHFEKVERARGDISLSYFEYTLLGILSWFAEEQPDVVILEVGLGGRLDATNALEPTASIVTTVDLDHMQFLGNTRDAIGWEKAHIYRKDRPAVCADPEPPAELIRYAYEIGSDLILANRDYKISVSADSSRWNFYSEKCVLEDLPHPGLLGEHQIRNAAGALALLSSIPDLFSRISRDDIIKGLVAARLGGRFECVCKSPLVICDVGHNPHAAKALKATLEEQRTSGGQTLAVFGMLKDKDRAKVCEILADSFDGWFVAGLPGDRGGSAEDLGQMLSRAGVDRSCVQLFDEVGGALQAALQRAKEEDKIIVFGSFVTVNEAFKYLHRHL
jgi:dihydrofolate synthase/folylpolyglutamate synthase